MPAPVRPGEPRIFQPTKDSGRPAAATRTWIGIDPGKNGCIAALIQVGDQAPVLKHHKLTNATDLDILVILRGMAQASGQVFATLELVRSSPQMGVVSAFSFGGIYRALKMALIASAIPFEEVTPPVWQGAMKCRSKGDKRVTRRKAQELFPQEHITDKTADAILLAEWCRRTRTNSHDPAPAKQPRQRKRSQPAAVQREPSRSRHGAVRKGVRRGR